MNSERATFLFSRVIAEGCKLIAEYANTAKPSFDRHYHFPRFLPSQGPFPTIDIAQRYDNPNNYGDSISSGWSAVDKSFVDTPEFKELVEFVRVTPALVFSLAYSVKRVDSTNLSAEELVEAQRITAGDALEFPCSWLIDRYIHLHGISDDFSMSKAAAIVEPLVNFLSAKTLKCDFCIPILFARIDCDRFELLPGVVIERISDDFQLARRFRAESAPVPADIFMAATHWIILKDRTVDIGNPPRSIWYSEYFDYPGLFPIADIDIVLASLRVVTGAEIGYAQLLVRPNLWVLDYKAYLPPVYGTFVRAYSSDFERFRKTKREYPTVTLDQCVDVANIYRNLVQHTKDAIGVATRRLNYCYVRDNAEDIVVDATIGLEAILSDGSSEINHKIATRMAAIATIADPTINAVNVFKTMRKIYDYRSAVVHGSKDAEKKRLIEHTTDSETHKIDAGWMAVNLLRMAIRILIEHPEFRKISAIDTHILQSLHRGIKGDNDERTL